MKFFQLLKVNFFVALLFVSVSCASVRTPTGGDKDEIAPTLINTIPKNTSTNFIGKKIVLEFDEAVQVNNIQKELIITPKIVNPFTAIAKYNKVTLTFEKSFDPNTTYTLNFRKAIGDINENNQAANLKLIFSTGPILDSLKFQVSVTDVYTGKPLSKGIATLYPVSDTINPKKQNPYYFTNIENGFGEFEYLHRGEYVVFVLTDNNDNQIYDSYLGERIGFIEGPIFVPRDSISTFKLSKEESEPLKIIDKSKYLNSYSIEFSKTPIAVKSNLPVNYYTKQDKKKWHVFRLPINTTDSLQAIVSATDSAGNLSTDSVKLFFNGKKINPIRQEPLYSTNSNVSSKLKPNESFKIIVKDSITSLKTDGFLIKYDTNAYETIKPTLLGKEISFLLKKATKAAIALKPNSFKTILNDTNKADTIKLSYATEEELGTITYTLKSKPSLPYYIELLTEAGNLIATKTNSQTGTFNNLEPGNYRIRYYIDADKNGIYTLGNQRKNRQAEEMITYAELIPVKANWEITDISW